MEGRQEVPGEVVNHSSNSCTPPKVSNEEDSKLKLNTGVLPVDVILVGAHPDDGVKTVVSTATTCALLSMILFYEKTVKTKTVGKVTTAIVRSPPWHGFTTHQRDEDRRTCIQQHDVIMTSFYFGNDITLVAYGSIGHRMGKEVLDSHCIKTTHKDRCHDMCTLSLCKIHSWCGVKQGFHDPGSQGSPSLCLSQVTGS